MTDLSKWAPPPLPPRGTLKGRYTTLEPLSQKHVPGLREAHAEDTSGAMWAYLPVGPFDDAGYAAWVESNRILHDPLHLAIRMRDGGTIEGICFDNEGRTASNRLITVQSLAMGAQRVVSTAPDRRSRR